MAQQFQVIVNAGKAQNVQVHNAEQGAGQRGRPLIIKAQAGAKYQLIEVAKGKD
ncbi:MAG: toxin determinant from serotypes 1/9, partial [Pseudomonadota bacterium]